MIIRQSLLRKAGRTIPVPATSWTRALATDSDGTTENPFRWGPEVKAPVKSDALIAEPTEPTIDEIIEATVNIENPVVIPPVNTKQHVINPKFNAYLTRHYKLSRNQNPPFRKLGATVDDHYFPKSLLKTPHPPSEITLELLLASQSHLGHATSLWNPRNSCYIFGIRQGIHIISLEVTAAHLRRACRVVSGVAERAGLILFVGTRSGQEKIVVKAATLAHGYHLFERWTPGTLTNGQQILGRCSMKVVDEFDREIPALQAKLELEERAVLRPDLVVCLNPLENWVMLHECGLNNIPTIGIIDTDADPTWITYPIPANDDSLRCVQLICGTLGMAAQQGRRLRQEMARQGVVTYTPTTL
ncbi:37S ribosomal protein, mitochondrial [Sticta canariensis]|nr:37S ribosomal protein, mitochondrial [Sticta canariensis]